MAATNHRATRVLLLLGICLLMQTCHAFEFKVGGSQGWTVPTDAAMYNHWAQKSRFQIGDSLLFVYSSDHDSVLHVTKECYENCSTENPLDEFKDGHTVYKFNQSGPHYFISGVAENCHKNEKLVVVVMADRSKHGSSNGTIGVPSPSPSPSEEMSPPSPAPSGEESPSPPAEEAYPTPAPSEESSHPKNGASSIASSVVGTIVVFFGSSFVLAL